MDLVSKDYIDVDDALKRIGGNMGLYKRLLGNFLAGDHIAPLANAANSGDYEEASRLAHTLKGVCANLSLIKLRILSAELEEVIKSGADCSEKISELSQAFDITVENISIVTAE